jgi:hypothetical protein
MRLDGGKALSGLLESPREAGLSLLWNIERSSLTHA